MYRYLIGTRKNDKKFPGKTAVSGKVIVCIKDAYLESPGLYVFRQKID